ncbi:MAG: 50S ribosomal protein L35 [Candidatus Spechtbacteria bacterium]|nr:50S ribosomal protein L35 [Candidatus Spechtbacteria bacterium]
MAKKGKTRKALTKRFKISSNGKVRRRVASQNHFSAKQTPKKRRSKRKMVGLSKSASKMIRRMLSR